jgi:uncharacterized membrane protein
MSFDLLKGSHYPCSLPPVKNFGQINNKTIMDKAEKIAGLVAITELFKQYGVLGRFCPLVTLVLGALLGYLEDPSTQGIVDGVLLGAVATGGYAVVKNSAKGVIRTRRGGHE